MKLAGIVAAACGLAIYVLAKSGDKHALVDVRKLNAEFQIELRYATADNLTNKPFYPNAMPCLLEKATATKLEAAAKALKAQGYLLKIWDAYRPPEAQQHLWTVAGKDGFVAKPTPGKRWSWHCYGRAVDVTLTSLDGKECEMPSKFDDFSDAAASKYKGNSAAILDRITKLQTAMRNAGFTSIEKEWWHFANQIAPPPAEPTWGRSLGLY